MKKHFVSKADALAALKEQKARALEKKPRLRLVQVLVKRKALDAARVAEVQDEIRRHTYICESCDARTVLAPSSNRSESACPRCGATISADPASRQSQVSESRREEFGSGRELAFPGPPGLDKFSEERRAFGRYELLEEIGRGAMGVVYRARHTELGKEVALKVLLAGEDAREAQVARFRREAAAVQKLRHDGIVPIHDFGAEGDVYYLTMDLVPGGLTLHRMWKDPELAPPLLPRVRQVAQVAHAIDHANSRGVIHRDLKPANVLIAPDGTPRVADFGLAKDEEDENALTLSQDRLGTPLFMAPEQVKRGSRGVDSRADIWALGVMLFVGVTGRYPFRGRTIMSLYMKILNEEPDWSGEGSSSPDREGWGKAPSPRELEAMQKQEGASHEVTTPMVEATESGSQRGSEQLRSDPGERPAPPAPFVPPRDLEGKEVPKDLRSIVSMALAKDPERRYESAGALARDLERFARGQRVHATPPGPLGRLWRRAKRRRALLLAALLLVVAPGFGVAAYLGHARAEEAARLGRIVKAKTATEAVWSRYVGAGSATFEGYEQAVRDLAPVCSEFADQPVPFIRRGLALAFLLEPDRARDDFVRAQANLEDKPGLPAEFASAAVLLALIRGEDARAVSLARAGLVASPEDGRLSELLAFALLRQGKADEAEKALAPLLDAHAAPDLLALGAEIALAAKDVKKAGERARRAHEQAPKDPHATAVAGLAALAEGTLGDARELLRTARDSFASSAPQDVLYFFNLAKARRTDRLHRDLKGAAEAGALAASLAPWSPVPGFWHADLERKDRHDVAAAIRELDECLARDPTFDEVAEIRAELLLARRDADGLAAAEKRFREEIGLVHRERAQVDLATILVGEGKPEEARPLLENLGSHALSVRALLLQAEIEKRSGRSDEELLARFQHESDRRSSSRRRDMIALARARLIRGDADGALASLESLTEGDDPRWIGFARLPDSRETVHALRATALAKLGRDDDALKELERAATRSLSDMAAEATPAILRLTPEFDRLGSNAGFRELLHRGGVD